MALAVVLILSVSAPAYALSQFTSKQIGTTPTNGFVLQTNGTDSTWVATSTLGITGGGPGSGTVTQVNTTYPILGGPITTTGTLSLDFGTTTANVWSQQQTFTLSPKFSTMTAGAVNSTAAGRIYNTSTSTPSVTAPITYSGTLGDFIGGISGAFDCITATDSVKGCLSAADHATFNGKQPAGNYITALTGDVSASGPGSAASTLATVNSNVGSFTNANITVNGKGLITAASNGVAGGGVTGVTATYPILSSGGTAPVISTAFGTTTSNLWAGTQTFTNPVVISSFSGLIAGNSGTTYAAATSTLTASSPLTGSFTQIGSGGSLGCQTASGSQAGCLSSADWTTFNGKLSSAITTLGPTGQGQTGATQTLASSTGSFNGLTTGLTIVGSGNTQTFTPSLSGTLNNAGLTNSTISGIALGSNLNAHTHNASLSGTSYNGSTAVSDWGLNLANPNVWSGLQWFQNATSSLFSVENKAYFGGTATTTIDSAGNIVVPSGSNLTVTGKSDGCATWATGVLNSTGTPCGSSSGGAAFPFTPATNFAVNTSATTTALWAQAGLFASSSSAYPTLAVKQSSTGPAATFDGGNVGISSTSPFRLLSVGGESYTSGTTTAAGGLLVGTSTMGFNVSDFGHQGLGNFMTNEDGRNLIVIGAHGNTLTTATAGVNAFSSRGTSAAPTASQAGDSLYTMGGRGYGTTDYGLGSKAAIIESAAQNWTDSANGTYITLETTPNNSTTRAEALRVDQSGNIGIGTTSPYALLSVSSNTTTGPTAILSGQQPLLQIGSSSPGYGYLANDRFNIIDNRNDYSAGNAYNLSAGSCATADWSVANDLNSTALNFGDLGHTSSGFTGTACANNPFTGFHSNSTYLFDPSGYMNFALGSTSVASFNWFTGGYAAANQVMTLTNAGNLGVGTTTPSQRLSIQGNGLFSGNLSSANLTATGTVTFSALTGTQCLHEISGVVSGTGSDCGGGSGVTGTTGQVAYLSGTNTAIGTSTIFIDTNGRVGIGSTTPFAALSVNPTASLGSAPRFVVGSSSATSLYIDSAGKIGFGAAVSAAISSPFQFLGASNASPNFSVVDFKSTTGDVNATFSSGNGNIAFMGQRNSGSAYFTGPNGFSIDVYGGATSVMFGSNTGAFCAGGIFTSGAATCTGTGLYIAATTLKTGISTTSPIAQFTMRAASTTAGTANDGYNGTIFMVAGLENTVTKLFEVIDQWGHRITGGDTPTVAGGTSTVAGNDNNGTITVTGTLLTSVTLTFAHAWPTAPDCTMADSSTGVTGAITSISSTQVVIGFSAGVNSGTVWYMCAGHQ